MKKIFIILFLFISCSVFAATYYVKNGGSDAATGLSDALAWATIARVNTAFSTGAIHAGDNIYFKRGSIFYGTLINDSHSGTSGSRITIGAYGTGDNPILSGFTTVTGWSSYGSNIHFKAISCESTPNLAALDDVHVPMGRYPKTTYLSYESSGANSITDNQLAASPSWTGAMAVTRRNDWIVNRSNITNHSTHTLTLSEIGEASYWGFGAIGYFFQNDLKCLTTTTGEWAYRSGNFYMYFSDDTPTNYDVKVPILDYVIYLTFSDYITVENLTVEGANVALFCAYNDCDYITVQDCEFRLSGGKGILIDITSDNSTVDNNTITSTCFNAISIDNESHYTTVSNNIITYSGYYNGTFDAWQGRGIMSYADHSLFEYNRVNYTANPGFQIRGTDVIIRYNVVQHFMLHTLDGGGSYIQLDSDISGIHQRIYNNFFMNSTSNLYGTAWESAGVGDVMSGGIYMDAGTTDQSIHDNTIANCNYSGIKLSCNRDDSVYNNTIYNTRWGINYLDMGGEWGAFEDNKIYNNYIVAVNTSYSIFSYGKEYAGGVSDMGTVDYNYYYKPLNPTNPINYYIYPYDVYPWPLNDISMTYWRSISTHDDNSVVASLGVSSEDQIHFFYNDSITAKNFIISAPMYDITGVQHSANIVLQPFTSMILFGNGTVTPEEGEPPLPAIVLTTSQPSYIYTRSGRGGGNVISDGGASVTDRGLCWSTSPNPTILDNHINCGSGTGIFSGSIDNLKANTTYHVRSYATNTTGTSYGDDYTFTTPVHSTGKTEGKFLKYNSKISVLH